MYHTLRPRRGHQRPDIGIYFCTGCLSEKPRIRNGIHVACPCGAAPNDQLARLWNLPDWPVVHAVQEVA